MRLIKALTIKILVVLVAITGVACSSPQEIDIPPAPPPPAHWNGFSDVTIAGSECPLIDGVYLEPPLVYRIGVDADDVPADNFDLYGGYIPFDLARRDESTVNETGLSGNSFAIQQPDTTQFYFMYFNEPTNNFVKYHFQLDQGDFECNDGHIEFPKVAHYGVIEGGSVNYQIRNILLKDEEGALVIQSTGGPYRGRSSKENEAFVFEFFKYLPK